MEKMRKSQMYKNIWLSAILILVNPFNILLYGEK